MKEETTKELIKEKTIILLYHTNIIYLIYKIKFQTTTILITEY